MQELARELGRVAPKNIGTDKLVQRIADIGTRLGVVAAITGLWPATAYGSGLRRAFDRLAGRKEQEAGLRGRGLLLLVLLPVFVVGSLGASFAGTETLGSSTAGKIVGFAVALGTGFLATAGALVLIYRIFPPERMRWGAIARATITTAAGISVLSALLIVFLEFGANFSQHYATSGLAGVVLLAVWLFLANVLAPTAYMSLAALPHTP